MSQHSGTDPYQTRVCPRCGDAFTCSASAKCWCYEVSLTDQALTAIAEQFDTCLCPRCIEDFRLL